MKNKKIIIPFLIIFAFLLLTPSFVFAGSCNCLIGANPEKWYCVEGQGITEDVCKQANQGGQAAVNTWVTKYLAHVPDINLQICTYFATNDCSSINKALAPATAQPEPPFTPIVPKLQINIPTVQFSKITKSGQMLGIPFLAEYIAGVYKYAVAIVSIVAILMIMAGGLRWMTAGGNASAVSQAKEMISGAAIGLILLLGSYTVLYAVNPDLINFKALQIRYVAPDPLDNDLTTATGDTAVGQEAGPPSTFTECPITLTATEDITASTNSNPIGPRSQEFISKISGAITATSISDKIAQISEAAVKCGVSLGSCGRTAEEIYKLAGTQLYSRKVFDISSSQRSALAALKCSGSYGSCNQQNWQTAFNQLKNDLGANWPDSYAKKLKPGDILVIFNANSGDNTGAHSAIFMGWADNGKANVIQGTLKKPTKTGTVCITTSCSNPQPLIRIWSY